MSADRIGTLNDQFRRRIQGSRMLLTTDIDSPSSDVKAMVIRKVATFDAFTEDNDPHAEHDFGSFELAGHKCSGDRFV